METQARAIAHRVENWPDEPRQRQAESEMAHSSSSSGHDGAEFQPTGWKDTRNEPPAGDNRPRTPLDVIGTRVISRCSRLRERDEEPRRYGHG